MNGVGYGNQQRKVRRKKILHRSGQELTKHATPIRTFLTTEPYLCVCVCVCCDIEFQLQSIIYIPRFTENTTTYIKQSLLIIQCLTKDVTRNRVQLIVTLNKDTFRGGNSSLLLVS